MSFTKGAASVLMGLLLLNPIAPALAASTVSYDEDFTGVSEGALPSGWVSSGGWGVYDADPSATTSDMVLTGDFANISYAQTANNTVVLPAINLSAANAAEISFYSACDTEYSTTDYLDYMALELAATSSSFSEWLAWDEYLLDEDTSDAGFAAGPIVGFVPSEFLTNAFTMQFRWVANGNSDVGSQGGGCIIDDLVIRTATVSFNALTAALAEAIELYTTATVGTNPGEYPQAAVDTFAAAIDEAFLARDIDAEQPAVNAATSDLEEAITTFEASVIPEPAPVLSDDATLLSMAVNGVALSGFASTTLSYTVQLPEGTIVVPVVSATTTHASSTKIITQASSLPGTASVAVTAQNGTTTATYTVSFTVAEPVPVSNDSSLESLAVNGTPLSGFASSTFGYAVELPFGTTVVPAVLGVATNENASVVVTPATTLPGTTTVSVTSESGSSTSAYTIAFTVSDEEPLSADATLSNLMISSSTVSGFAPNTLSYNIELPTGTTVVPTVSAVGANASSTVVVTQATLLPGTATVGVTAQDGVTTKTYSISFTVAAAPSGGGGGGGGGGGSSSASKDKTAPSNLSIAIESNATQTTKRSVKLTLSAKDESTPLKMQISEDPKFANAKWVTFEKSYNVTLSSGEGTKTLYARFRDRAGNVSATVSDSIVYGTKIPENAATPLFPALGTSTVGSVLGTSTYSFLVDFGIGSTGVDVTELQKRLTREGLYLGPITGYFGPLTMLGVKTYQLKAGVSGTGYVGPLTRSKLNATVSAAPVVVPSAAPAPAATTTSPTALLRDLHEGHSGADVTLLQGLLAKNGSYNGPVTGYFGALTRAGVKIFQLKQNLPVTGILDGATRSKLSAL